MTCSAPGSTPQRERFTPSIDDGPHVTRERLRFLETGVPGSRTADLPHNGIHHPTSRVDGFAANRELEEPHPG